MWIPQRQPLSFPHRPPEDEGIRDSRLESIALSGVDVSNLIVRYHFPKLRDLYLSDGFKVSCWDHLKSYTMALVNLTLSYNDRTPPSVIPTTLQVLSLLASNPNIRTLELGHLVTSDDGGNGSASLVSLCHLERLIIVGYPHHVFPILHRLELPETVDCAILEFQDCTLEEAYEAIGPYFRNYLRRDPRFKERLGVFISTTPNSFSFRACTAGVGHHGLDRMPSQGTPDVVFRIVMYKTPREDMERLCIDILAFLPRESVVCLEVNFMEIEEVVVMMPNLELLSLTETWVYDGILLPDPDGPNAQKKLFPSLQRLSFKGRRSGGRRLGSSYYLPGPSNLRWSDHFAQYVRFRGPCLPRGGQGDRRLG